MGKSNKSSQSRSVVVVDRRRESERKRATPLLSSQPSTTSVLSKHPHVVAAFSLQQQPPQRQELCEREWDTKRATVANLSPPQQAPLQSTPATPQLSSFFSSTGFIVNSLIAPQVRANAQLKSLLVFIIAVALATSLVSALAPLEVAPDSNNNNSSSSSSNPTSNGTAEVAAATTAAPAPSQTTTTTTTTTSTTAQPPVLELLVLEPGAQQVLVNESESPRSERQHVLDMFNKFFTKARSHDDQQQKEFVRDGVILRLRELGFETSFLQKSSFEFRRRPANSYNMISILPGRFRQTKRDRIVLVGAHWDSATKAPGVDDNGSGSTCLLEIARLIAQNRCQFNHTVMLVWFDYEEQGKFGSEFFVNDYLFPLELEKYGSKFIGAYILDMILVRDKENGTQQLPLNLKTKLIDFSEEIEREKYRGDFLATWSRKTHDEPLEEAFRSAWLDLGFESRTFKAMRPELPQSRLPNHEERYEWKDFFRSDHASFWFPPLTSTAVRRAPNRTSTSGHSSLNAILLTDLGPWRKSYQKCYHSACDDEHLLTEGNLSFMQQVIDSLVLTLLRVGGGRCKQCSIAAVESIPSTNLPGTLPLPATNSTQAARMGCISRAQAH